MSPQQEEQQRHHEQQPDGDAPAEDESVDPQAGGLTSADNAASEIDPLSLELSPEAAAILDQLAAERDEAVAQRQSALAEFHNYQRRAAANERQAAQAGAGNVIRSLLAVVDHFDLALEQDIEQLTVEQLLGGVRIVRDELAKALQSQGVQRIEPAIGDEFDPNRHEAIMRQESDEVPANHVVSVLQVGYQLADVVLRPAKVAVAASSEGAE